LLLFLMATSDSGYMNWKAPEKDRQWLIWPEPAELLRNTIENNQLLNTSAACVQGIPLPELRREQRRLIGHIDSNVPLIASGHQTELYHPGVWVKDALANAAAAKLGGRAYHLAVDTDSPKHLSVRWPGTSIPLSDDPALTSAEWTGLLHSPTPAHLQMIERRFAEAAGEWNFRPMLGSVLASLSRLSVEGVPFAAALTAAQHELDLEIGLTHEAVLVGKLLRDEPYGAFVHHVLSGAQRFAADYNAALAAYRSGAGITSATRPMPDLLVLPESIESPFWFDDLSRGTRNRAHVFRCTDVWVLRHDGDEFSLNEKTDGWAAARQLNDWLGRHNLRLSPRALTLTTFLRLLVADQFVHGIGGGRYDQVTDLLIARHFGLTPPKFSVTTATLRFPLAVGRERICLHCLEQEGHTLRHGLLGERKREIVEEIATLPRRSIQRSLAFHNMHGALTVAATNSSELRDWEARRNEAAQRDRDDEIIFDRELFYALQPRERLGEMLERYREQFV
jgi:hypothetical protein